VVFEAHLPPRNGRQRWVLARSDRVVANTAALARDMVDRGHVPKERVLGIHQGVDAGLIGGARPSKADLRAKLGVSERTKLIVYTGKIYRGYREVEYLLDAARALEREEDVLLILVGGRADHVAHFRKRVVAERRRNARFVGFVSPAVARDYQQAADVLVLYYPSGLELNRYRSPGKLFEYMAAGRPIVSVDLPVLTEVLGEPPAAALVAPDSPPALADEISRLLHDPERARHLSELALRRVRRFTWDARARSIAAFIGAA
jgi:glycosyltransferase involved in cell wall biosynthesis